MALLARIALLVLVLATFSACADDVVPPLVQVVDVTPRDAEVGDRLEVMGEGFPLGKVARVTFRGALYRPGEPPARHAEITAEAQVASAERVDVVVTDALESLFCGAGDTAAHTTFRGDVEVAFAAASPAAPPVTGSLSDVTLDFRPKGLRRSIEDGQLAEGQRTLAFLGLRIADGLPPSGGLLIEGVASGSPAATAGLGPGDVLVRFDEVRVLSAADVIPSGEGNRAHVVVRRADGVRQDTLEVDLAGYEPRAPRGLLGAAILLTLTALCLLLFVAPTAGHLTGFERRVARELGGSADEGLAARLVGAARRAIVDAFGAELLGAGSPARISALAVGITVPFLVVPLAVSLFAADVDVGVLYLVTVTAVVMLSVLSAFAPGAPKGRFTTAVRQLTDRLLAEVPRAIALAAVVVLTGSLRLSDIVRGQGPMPWEWLAFRQPMTLVLFFVFLLGSLAPPRPSVETAALPVAEPARGRADESRKAPWLPLALADHAHMFLMSGLAAALFLGGWRLPLLGPGEQEARVGFELAGGALFVLKASVVTGVVLAGRLAVPYVTGDDAAFLSWKVRVPLALLAFAFTAAWMVFGPARPVQLVVSAVTCAASALVLLATVVRIRRGMRVPESRMQLNPFL